MYSIKNLKPNDLAKIEVKNQAQIIELIGKKLDPKEAFNVIKKDSMDFTQSNQKAEQADRLFMQLLALNGVKVKASKTKNPSSALDLQAQARARALVLLELEIELAA